ncbi:hypothetical protein A2379_01075 [Candidatus Amesbacteria bacterium RIFOXYB1_FULL_47_13]|nr:MAG: hypothetical protein A2379_01075 [Candidatus Amesbacteria bacterium RIFOXYB1_FULL_47_13]
MISIKSGEGYKSGTAGSFIRYLNISCGSLGELKGDIDDCLQDKLITQDEFNILDKLSGTTDYLIQKMIKSIREAEKSGKWKNFNS